jgi:hypothetical protein
VAAQQAVQPRKLHPAAAIALGFALCLVFGGIVYGIVSHYIAGLPGHGYGALVPTLFLIGIPVGAIGFAAGVRPLHFFVVTLIAEFIWFCGAVLLGMPGHVASIVGLVVTATSWGAVLGSTIAAAFAHHEGFLGLLTSL